nr:MAG TPA: hypothetical protein [Caudoviricetes sp.]
MREKTEFLVQAYQNRTFPWNEGRRSGSRGLIEGWPLNEVSRESPHILRESWDVRNLTLSLLMSFCMLHTRANVCSIHRATHPGVSDPYFLVQAYHLAPTLGKVAPIDRGSRRERGVQP